MKINRIRNNKRFYGTLFFIEKCFLLTYIHNQIAKIWQLSFLQTLVNVMDM